MYDKDKIKNDLSIEEVADIVAELGGEPVNKGDHLICKTICHNGEGNGSHKLYYYDNTKLFRCFTGCAKDTFDIFELVSKIKSISLYESIKLVATFFGLNEDRSVLLSSQLADWKIFDKYLKDKEADFHKKSELKVWDDSILQQLPRFKILPWLREGITQQVMNQYDICYDPVNQGIVIPHYDINNHLIGIRERTLIVENEETGKYKPAILNGVMYNHPLGFNLYSLNKSKEAIAALHKAILFESEKSTLLYASYFGLENNISVACCGSNFTQYQFNLLQSLGVTEIIVGFDRQYKEIGDDEWKIWTKKLTQIHDKYGAYVQISYLFDKGYRLGYKQSPIDLGKDLFLQLYQERIKI